MVGGGRVLSRLHGWLMLLVPGAVLTLAVPAHAQLGSCVGDCNGNGKVTVDELVKGVNIVLGTLQLGECPSFDCNHNQHVTVNCLVTGVNSLLNGCVAVATATPTLLPTQPMTYSQSQIFAAGSLVALDDSGGIAVVWSSFFVGSQSATVFVNGGAGWSQATQLSNSDKAVASVAISGDGNTIVVGSCGNAVCAGHAFVYTVANRAWPTGPMSPTATLNATNALAGGGDRIGNSVAVDQAGDTIAVGAPCDYTAGNLLCGTVYVYQKFGTGWLPQDAQLTAGITPTVGFSVSMDAAGQTIVAGGPLPEAGPSSPGAAYVFVKPETGWKTTSTPSATLTESKGNNGDHLGWSAAISSDGHTVVAGALNYPNNQSCPVIPCSTAGPGAAFVFVNPSAPSAWKESNTENATLTAKNGQNGDDFGYTTAISQNGAAIVAGAPGIVAGAPGFVLAATIPGTAYVFQESTGGWSGPQNETQALTASSGTAIGGLQSVTPSASFGRGLSLSSDAGTIGVGGVATVGTTPNQQVVYLFR